MKSFWKQIRNSERSMKYILFIMFIVVSAHCAAQTLIPYLGKNGLTGFADTNGKVIIKPQFTEVSDCFQPNLPSIRAKKEGQPVWVFRNGITVPDTNSNAFYDLNHQSVDYDALVDTLKELAIVSYINKRVLVHLRTGRQIVSFDNPKNSVEPWFQKSVSTYLKHYGYSGYFVDGLMMVGRPNGLVNYLDTSLNFVFEQDYPGMLANDKNTFIVANLKQKVAIANRQGRFLSPFKFGKLVLSGKDGFYISDPLLQGFERDDGVKAGVVNKKGEYVIPAKYDNIRPAGERFLIISTPEGEGVIDFEGNIVMPPMPGKLRFATDELFIHENDKQQRIIKANGEPIVTDVFKSIFWEDKLIGITPHFIFSDEYTAGAFAPSGRLIVRDSFKYVHVFNFNGKTCFKSRHIIDGKTLFGMIDFDGKELLPHQYDEIETMLNHSYLLVKKQGLSGILDANLQPLLPLLFEESDASIRNNVVELYGRLPGQHIWYAYDGEGKRTIEKDCLHPGFARNELAYVPNLRNNPTTIITKEKGEMPLPNEIRTWKNLELQAVDTPAGLLLVASSEFEKQARFYDKDMKPIIPEGFEFPYEEFNYSFMGKLKATGLIVVYQKRDSLINGTVRNEKEPIQDNLENKQVTLDQSIEEEFVVKNEKPKPNAKMRVPPYMGSGVLNAKGEWVIQPTEDAKFQPISWNLILEFPYGNDLIAALRRMHRVNHPKPEVFSISRAECYISDSEKNKYIKAYQTLSRKSANFRTYHTWFTYDGEQLAPFQFTEGPNHLGSYNAVRVEENGQYQWLIVDDRCQTMFALENIDDKKARNQEPYFRNGHLVYSQNGLDGLVDSTGKQVLPFKFNELSIDMNGKYLHEFTPNPNGKGHQLLDWKGNVLYESSAYIETHIDKHKGIILIGLDMDRKENYRNGKYILLSPKGKVIGEVHGYYATSVSMPEPQSSYYKFKDANGKEFWVDITRTLIFKEQ